MELEPAYVQVGVDRWAKFTGKDPILETTGQRLSELRRDGRRA
jgi:hypothetical protein